MTIKEQEFITKQDMITYLKNNLSLCVYNDGDYSGDMLVIELYLGNDRISKDSIRI